MDPQLGNTMRNIIGLWTTSYILCTFIFFTYIKNLQKNTFLWHVNGILSVTYSMEVGVCICYLWTKHSCPGIIPQEDWMNWCSWILILIFIPLLIIFILKFIIRYFSSFFMILLFSMNFTNIESIIFLMPILRVFFWFFFPSFF